MITGVFGGVLMIKSGYLAIKSGSFGKAQDFGMPSPDFINQKECFNFVRHSTTFFTQTGCEMNSIKSLQELEIAQREILSKQPSFTLEQAKAQVERLKKQSSSIKRQK